MTQPATITQSDMDRAAKAAARSGVTVEIEVNASVVYRFRPDGQSEARPVNPADLVDMSE